MKKLTKGGCMRKWIVALMLIIFAAPAFAGRTEDLRKRYNKLQAQRELITAEMLRIEGQFRENQYQAEQKALAKKTQEAEIAEINAEIEKAVSGVSRDAL